MKVLHVITSLGPSGAERLMVDLLPHLQTFGVEVELLLFNGIREPEDQFEALEAARIPIHHFTEDWNLYSPKHIYRLTKVIGKYDIVHTHNTACQLFAAMASVVAPTILCTTEHNTHNRRRDKWYFKPLDKWMYSRYASVVCVGDQVRENLCRYLNDYRPKYRTVYNGIDIGRFENASPLQRAELGLSENDFVLTMVSLFRYQKDQDTIIKAMGLLPKNFKLLLVGEGDRKPILRELATSLGVEDQVIFIGQRQDVPQILKTVDVVVQSSHFEGLSLSSVEAMAAGKPIVASDVDGLREVVNGAGLLFEHGNHEQLANIIKLLSDSKEYYREIVSRCQQHAAKYSIEAMAQGYKEVYDSLMPKTEI